MGLTPLPPGAIRPGRTRTLLALIAVYDETGRATIRDVAARSGRTVSATHADLTALSKIGLVDGVGVSRGGALRPTLAIGTVR